MLTRQYILDVLHESDPHKLDQLWRKADDVRHESVGDEVHLRGLVEWSNCCRRQCAYCGLRAGNADLTRYRMTAEEVLECAQTIERLGYGTMVLQAGEDEQLTRDVVADVVRRIKASTSLAVTLSLGERTFDELAEWRAAGADRYLLRFETSDNELYNRIHPPRAGNPSRFEILRALAGLGFEAGSGVMVGIPGQSYESLANDIELFTSLGLDMIGIGPYLPHPHTPLGRGELPSLPEAEQVPNTELMTYKVLALTRLAVPLANIPSTTALATLNYEGGREGGLMRGGNVVMPNVTPPHYRRLYEIYPAKACIRESAEDFDRLLRQRLASIGRRVGSGAGQSREFGRKARKGQA